MTRARGPARPSAAARRSRRKFLEYFPDAFRDETYLETERSFKWLAHQRWTEQLGREEYAQLLAAHAYTEIAQRAVRIESRTMLLFSFEKMAIRDAVKSPAGARAFAEGLGAWLYGPGAASDRFTEWCDVVAALPRRQTRVLTWPVVTVFGFIAKPKVNLFLKPTVTRRAADAYEYPFDYRSQPTWSTYKSLLDFGKLIRRDLSDWRPRDLIDIQSFIWVQGSDEYP